MTNEEKINELDQQILQITLIAKKLEGERDALVEVNKELLNAIRAELRRECKCTFKNI